MSKLTPEVRANIQKLKEEQEKLRKLKEGFPSEVEKILYQEGWRVMGKSIKRAPIDHGLLRASARVDLPVREGGKISIELSYNTNYAKWVHEKNDHGEPVKYRAPGTESMFLSNVIFENIQEMEDRINRRLSAYAKRMVR